MHVDQVRQRCTFLTAFGLQLDWLRYALLTPSRLPWLAITRLSASRSHEIRSPPPPPPCGNNRSKEASSLAIWVAFWPSTSRWMLRSTNAVAVMECVRAILSAAANDLRAFGL